MEGEVHGGPNSKPRTRAQRRPMVNCEIPLTLDVIAHQRKGYGTVMTIRELEIPAVKLIVPKRFSDARGYFSEIWSEHLFREEIANVTFVQDNQSMSLKRGTLRGLHFQKPPHAQGKLVRVLRGSIYDAAVDIRRESPTYGNYVAVKLDAMEG